MQGLRMWGAIKELQQYLGFDMEADDEPKRPARRILEYLENEMEWEQPEEQGEKEVLDLTETDAFGKPAADGRTVDSE